MLGSIAQLVQSVCLTSRGSGVRLPLLPRKKRPVLPVASFVMMKVETPDPEADEVCAGIIRCRAKNSEALALGRWCARSALPRNGGRGEILTGDSLCSHKNNGRNYPAVVFVMMKVEPPDPLRGGIYLAAEWHLISEDLPPSALEGPKRSLGGPGP